MSRISSLPVNQRPRERLLLLGPQAISTLDLLSIVLGNGTQSYPVEKLSRQIEVLLQQNRIQSITKELLATVRGLGRAKLCALLALFELAERFHTDADRSFNSPEVVVSFLQELRDSPREMLVCLYLNARYQLVHKEVVAVGSLNQTVMHPRDVFAPIMHHPVAFIILAHNHPSGDPKPSEDDKEFTLRMQEAGELLGVELVDHIIIARGGRFSFKEEKYL